MTTSILDLEGESFVALTTSRRSGESVSTPVWIARDGDAPAAERVVRRGSARVVLRLRDA